MQYSLFCLFSLIVVILQSRFYSIFAFGFIRLLTFVTDLFFGPLFLPPAFYIWGDFCSKIAFKPALLLGFHMSYLTLFFCDIFCDMKTMDFAIVHINHN